LRRRQGGDGDHKFLRVGQKLPVLLNFSQHKTVQGIIKIGIRPGQG
jgi:hypothetical protein